MKIIKKNASFIPEPDFLMHSLLIIQVCYFFLFITNGVPGYSLIGRDIFSMLYGILTLIFFSASFRFFHFNYVLKRFLILILIFLFWALNAYQLSSGTSLDFSLVKDNIGESLSVEAFTMISTPFGLTDILFLLIILLSGLFIEYKFNFIRREEKISVRPAFTAFLIWVFMLILPVQSGDGFTLFVKSFISGTSSPAYAQPVSTGYPYEKNRIPLSSFSSSVPSAKRDKPNVFLIMIESFNANFVEAKAPDGIDYTPNFNSLIETGLYIDRFYGNSIQTCKGQAAVFFSILPSFNGKLFIDYPDLNIQGFPAVLNGAGYLTVFFQAYHNLKFDNTEESLRRAGFSEVRSYSEFRKKEDKPSIWGWGVEDKVFYERFFGMIDSLHQKSPDKPVFAALMTIGTHIPCDGLPPEKRTIYKDPQNIKEKYSNALRLSDSQLPRFFELLKERSYLENSIVIITSDHSFPMKEHGIYNNEVCFYDEAFRIPFLVIWDGVIKPERLKDRAYSQIDIGPTIADMLGISESSNNMTGISVFDRKTDHPVYLIQPYNGRFLQVIKYPFKYISHLKTGNEYLFNLEKDPVEKFNLMLRSDSAEIAAELRDSLKAIYLNQQLIDGNMIRRK